MSHLNIIRGQIYCENPPTTLNKVDQRPHDTQGWSGSHDLITTWPPILNKPIATYTGQLTLPSRIYFPNFSLYMSFRTEHCWRKLRPTDVRRTLIQCCKSSFFLVLIDKPWRHVKLHTIQYKYKTNIHIFHFSYLFAHIIELIPFLQQFKNFIYLAFCTKLKNINCPLALKAWNVTGDSSALP
jgi:hypothetical protein